MIQWAEVTVTPLGMGKAVTINDFYSNCQKPKHLQKIEVQLLHPVWFITDTSNFRLVCPM